MLGQVGDLASKASGLLGGGGTAASAPKGEAKYKNADPFGEADTAQPGAVGPNAAGSTHNLLEPVPPIEYIHFGRIHADSSRAFVHDELADTAPATTDEAEAVKKKLGRGIEFRSATERECVLLHGFIASCQKVLTEYQANRGMIGEVGALAGNLLGSGASEPSPDEMDALLDAVSTAGGLVNKLEIVYPKVHKAGIDLHQTRADFGEFAKRLEKHYSGEGNKNDPGAALKSLPGVAKNALMVQKLVFKVFDIYLVMYLNARREFETDIEDASYALTRAAIKAEQVPTFPVWFRVPAPVKSAKEEKTEDDDNLLAEANKAIEDAKKDVEDKIADLKKKVDDFLGLNEPELPPGAPHLDALFTALEGSAADTPKDAPADQRSGYARVTVDAFATTLGLGALPGFVSTALVKLTDANLDYMHAIYKGILNRGATPVSNEVLMEIGRERLIQAIIDLLMGLLPFDPSVNIAGKKVGADTATDKVGDFSNEKFGKHAEHVLKIAVGQLSARMNEALEQAGETNRTMEIMLGRLPWFLALMTRNTFFPVWDILVDTVFGSIAGPLKNIASPIKSFAGDAKRVADDVKGYADKAKNIQDKMKNVKLDAKDPNAFLDQFKDDKAKDEAAADAKPGPFPGTPRVVAGQGKKITKAEYEEAKAQFEAIRNSIVAA